MSNINKSYSSPVISRVVADTTGAWKKRTKNVQSITLHHCAGFFEPSLRFLTKQSFNTSAHFMIQDADCVLMNGPSERACWSDGNDYYNYTTVSIEMANSSLAPNWGITEGTLRKTAELCADLARFYGLGKLVLHKNIVLHTNVADARWATACPGPTGISRAPDVVRWANEINGYGSSSPAPKPSSSNNSFLVQVTASALNIRQAPNTTSRVTGVIRDKGAYTIIEQSGSWGRLKSGAGWIHLDYTKRI